MEAGISVGQAEQSRGFSGVIKSMKCLTVNKVSEMSGLSRQLLMVEGQLWSLLWDQIQVLAPDGSVVKKLNPGLSIAWDMCFVGSHVIVADTTGLLQLSTDGQLVQQLDDGEYWSVTSCGDHRKVWAVKAEGDRYSKLWICKFDVNTKKQLVKLQTEISSGGRSMNCALLHEKLYLCSNNDHCIYCVDTSTGATLSVHGNYGSTAAGELHYPWTIYSDEESQSLLVTDFTNRRLQVLDTVENSWSVVKTTGDVELKSTAVSVDDHRNLWIGASYPFCIYTCTL